MFSMWLRPASEQLYLYASISLTEKETYARFLANFVQGVDEACVHEWGKFVAKAADKNRVTQTSQAPKYSSITL